MKRKVEFRGKEKLTGRWAFGDLVHYPQETLTGPLSRVTVGSYEVDPETIGQFTGLKDKNGEEIYEGDLLLEIESEKVVCIEWDEFEYGYRYVKNNYGYKYPNHVENFKIIGNIYDNPKLSEL